MTGDEPAMAMLGPDEYTGHRLENHNLARLWNAAASSLARSMEKPADPLTDIVRVRNYGHLRSRVGIPSLQRVAILKLCFVAHPL